MRVRFPRRSFHLVTMPLALSLGVGLLSGCPARNELEVRWTIAGQNVADGACTDIGDTVAIHVFSEDQADAPATEEVYTANCSDESAQVQAGTRATVTVSLLRGETEVGASRPQTVSFVTPSENPSITSDIVVNTGRLEAVLLVAGESCGDAGANSFDVVLRRAVFSLDTAEVDTATVTCSGGEARYINDSVQVGTRHFVRATTTVGGTNFGTVLQGVGVDLVAPKTVVTVNLRDEALAPVLDAGPDDIGNPPPFDSGTPVDAGAVDAGAPDAGTDDAGVTDAGTTDAGTTDAGTTDAGTTDAGTTDAGTTDAGTTDAGTADAGADDAGTSDAGTTDAGASDAG